MVTPRKSFKLPTHFEIEAELREQISNRPGHQRCVEGRDELLLVVHEVPQAGIPEREAVFFWKRHGGRWSQPGGTGLSELGELLERYALAIDGHQDSLDKVPTAAAAIFGVLRHSGPLARSTRNLALALEQALAADLEDREIRAYRDRARELDRAAELLNADARVALEYCQAARSEEQSLTAERLRKNAFRLNLLAGFFLPLMALGSWCGVNAKLPAVTGPLLAGIFLGGIATAALLPWFIGRQTCMHAGRKRKPEQSADPATGKISRF